MMVDTPKPVMNVADVPLRDFGNGGAFAARIGSFGRTIGLSGLGVSLTVVEPGKRAYPFHVHHQTHEMFVILEGEGAYRFGDQSYPIKANDVLAAPIGGPEFAHQIINTGTTALRYLAISANFVGRRRKRSLFVTVRHRLPIWLKSSSAACWRSRQTSLYLDAMRPGSAMY